MTSIPRTIKSRLSGLLLFAFLITLAQCSMQKEPVPPVANIEPRYDTTHGDIRVDNYYWLRQRDDSAVLAYLEAENDYTEKMMKHTEKSQEKIYKELLGRLRETDEDVPAKKGKYYYYTRTEKGKQYKIYCRKKGNLEADEEILLDINQMAEGHDFFELGVYEVSPDHKLLGYSVDTNGSENYDLYVLNLETGVLFPEVIPNTSYSLEWGNDNKTIFYTTMDETHRPDKLHRHTLGTDASKDALIHHEKDQQYFVDIAKTRSEKYLLLYMGSITTTEVRYLDANAPTGQFKIFYPRQHEMEYYVDHHGDKFYIRSNENAKNFKLLTTPVESPDKANWKELIAHRDSIKIDDFDLFKNHIVVYERERGLNHIHITNLSNGAQYFVRFPEPVYDFIPTGNNEFDTDQLRFTYFSLVTPKSVFDYDMNTNQRVLKKEYEVKGYDKTLYESERIFATAADGRQIPMSLVYKKSLKRDAGNPLYLYAYGSYGYSLDPYFSSNRISYLDRGFVFVIAHIRGGGEMGRYWYDEGKLLNKKNTFTDFITCAEHLIKENYTIKDQLVISGGSAGGLLMGAVVNMRPELFEVAVADVPFVDVINTMLDSTIPLTVTEFEEWGNPFDSQYYEYMKSYSPYDNVDTLEYPHMLITAGLNDPRVQYWEPAKWTAKLRTHKKGSNWLILKTNMGSGHMGASGRYDYLREIAFEMAFNFDRLKIKD